MKTHVSLSLACVVVLLLTGCQTRTPVMGEKQVVCNINGDDADHSMDVVMNRCQEGLNIAITVRDDTIVGSHKRIYDNDMVELYFDFRPVRKRTINAYESGVVKLDLLPSFFTKNPDSIGYYPKFYKTVIPGICMKSRLTKTGYTIDVFIPNSGLRLHHYPLRDYLYVDYLLQDADPDQHSQPFSYSQKEKSWKYPFNFQKVVFK